MAFDENSFERTMALSKYEERKNSYRKLFGCFGVDESMGKIRSSDVKKDFINDKFIQEYRRIISNENSTKGLWVSGPRGIGKTFPIHASLNERFVEKNVFYIGGSDARYKLDNWDKSLHGDDIELEKRRWRYIDSSKYALIKGIEQIPIDSDAGQRFLLKLLLAIKNSGAICFITSTIDYKQFVTGSNMPQLKKERLAALLENICEPFKIEASFENRWKDGRRVNGYLKK